MKLFKAILSVLLPIFLIFRFWRPDQPLTELLVFFLCAVFILYFLTPRRPLLRRGDQRAEFIAGDTKGAPFQLADHPGFRLLCRNGDGAVYSDKYGVIICTEYRSLQTGRESGESPVVLLLQCLITACIGLVLFHLGEAAWGPFSVTGQLTEILCRLSAVGEHLLYRASRLFSDLYGAAADLYEKVKVML